MNLLQQRNNSDILGILASGLCLAHCITTPFLFMAQAGSLFFEGPRPTWWTFLDIIFLILSFFAIQKSAKTTAKPEMKYLFWIGWGLLFVFVINEKLSLFPLPEVIIYVVSLLLVGSHFYNMKYCSYENKSCTP